jgi:hypothetical protein
MKISATWLRNSPEVEILEKNKTENVGHKRQSKCNKNLSGREELWHKSTLPTTGEVKIRRNTI